MSTIGLIWARTVVVGDLAIWYSGHYLGAAWNGFNMTSREPLLESAFSQTGDVPTESFHGYGLTRVSSTRFLLSMGCKDSSREELGVCVSLVDIVYAVDVSDRGYSLHWTALNTIADPQAVGAATLPQPVHLASTATRLDSANTMYVYGGTNELLESLPLWGLRPENGDPMSDTWVWRLTPSVTAASAAAVPPPMYGSTAAYHAASGYVYVVGGCTSQPVSIVDLLQCDASDRRSGLYRFHVDTLQWSEVVTTTAWPPGWPAYAQVPLPGTRFGASAVISGDHLFVYGGAIDPAVLADVNPSVQFAEAILLTAFISVLDLNTMVWRLDVIPPCDANHILSTLTFTSCM